MGLQKIFEVGKALLTVLDDVNHYTAKGKNDRYAVWMEQGERSQLDGDNRKNEQTIYGSIDYLTKHEDDPNMGLIPNALSNAGISYMLLSVQYEEETEYIHYEWEWEV